MFKSFGSRTVSFRYGSNPWILNDQKSREKSCCFVDLAAIANVIYRNSSSICRWSKTSGRRKKTWWKYKNACWGLPTVGCGSSCDRATSTYTRSFVPRCSATVRTPKSIMVSHPPPQSSLHPRFFPNWISAWIPNQALRTTTPAEKLFTVYTPSCGGSGCALTRNVPGQYSNGARSLCVGETNVIRFRMNVKHCGPVESKGNGFAIKKSNETCLDVSDGFVRFERCEPGAVYRVNICFATVNWTRVPGDRS